MAMRRPRQFPVGQGEFGVPYDQSGGGQMPGMDLPNPGGAMKKLSLEFADAQDAAAQTGIPEGAGVPPAGMQQGGIPQGGMQSPQQAPPMQQDPMQGMGQGAPQSVFAGLMGGGDQMQQGPDSGMFTDDMLMGMAGGEDPSMMDPAEIEGQQMHDQMMDPSQLPPEVAQQMQMQLMEAARRRGGF